MTAVFVAWTVVGLVSTVEFCLFRLSIGAPVNWTEALANSLASVWLWAGFTPAIAWLSRRVRVQRQGWPVALFLHAVFALGFDLLDVVVDALLAQTLPFLGGPERPLLTEFLGQSFINLFSYFAVVAIVHAIDYHGLFAERELAASRLEAQLLGAQLRALEMQLHPHFLFNTLHTIASLVRANRNPAAVQTIAGLSDLLRAALRSDGAAEVPLREELAFIERYLEIERIRFRDRLETRISAEPEALDALVPTLILQPLVENAIRHGIERRAAPGRVEVSALLRNGSLLLRVQDSSSGSSLGTPDREGGGIGLSNTQARLHHLYGERQRFQLTATPEGGAVALVELPFHCEPLEHVPSPSTGGAVAGPDR
jgi:two-component system LytT family sensor kinase